MVGVLIGAATSVHIVGHGIKVSAERQLVPSIVVSPVAPIIKSSFGSRTVSGLRETLNVMAMEPLADFSLLVSHPNGGKALATTAWNALWVFHLLALACRRPVMSLYTVADSGTRFTLANRNLVIHRLATVGPAATADLDWAAVHFDAFNALLKVERFQHAVRYYGNAHYLFDNDAKIMLLWAGIEGLLGVDAELRRRVALHAAILFDGTPDEKSAYFARIKKGYDVRSKVVHGTGAKPDDLSLGYALASEVLLALLRKCVELGRVPSSAELDGLAASVSVAPAPADGSE